MELPPAFPRYPEGQGYSGELVAAHVIARAIYREATGCDLNLMELAFVIRNSIADPDILAAALDGGGADDPTIKAALAISPAPDEESIVFAHYEVNTWLDAIIKAAEDEKWPLFDLRTLAPRDTSAASERGFVLEECRVLEWLERAAPFGLAGRVRRALADVADRGMQSATNDPSYAATGNKKDRALKRYWELRDDPANVRRSDHDLHKQAGAEVGCDHSYVRKAVAEDNKRAKSQKAR